MKFIFLFYLLVSFSLHAKTLQFMSYNVENLFDTKHDLTKDNKDKKDWTFLPKGSPGKKEACLAERSKHYRKECIDSDWTEAKLNLKLSQITDVVMKERALPDFLGLVEVENENVVGMLAHKLGYENIEMTDSPDERGVDVALLYRTSKEIKKILRAEHVVPVDYPTRNILEVEFLIDEKYPLTIFVNHWPSLANPDSWRVKAAEIVVARSLEILKKDPHMAILLMGDFNTADDNNPHPFKSVLYRDNLFTDVGVTYSDEKLKKTMAPGTYFFAPKDQWNYLDHFFMNKNLIEGKELHLDPKSFEIYSPHFITEEVKKKYFIGDEKNYKIEIAPKRFNPEGNSKETIGFSDHFPILVKLDYPETPIKKSKKENKKKAKPN